MKSLSVRLGVIFPVIGLIIFGYGFRVVIIANAQSTLALQEKCAEGARKWLKDHGSEVIYGYSSHYNKKLDKCFIRVNCFYSETEMQLVMLGDAFEGKSIGSCFQKKDGTLMGCIVGKKVCKSMEEFEALIKPYMEE